ncbi:MAG: hypothetical protein AAFP90_15140, partial [Planctomycetota bacterium]
QKYCGPGTLPALDDLQDSDEKGYADLLDEAAQAAILRFERDDFATLDPRRLDDAAKKMWTEVPMGKKLAIGLTPLATLMATLGAAVAVPFDLGTSASVMAISIPEMLAASTLTGFAVWWAGNQGTESVAQQAAQRQLMDFTAILCDVFGVPRAGTLPNTPLPTLAVGGKTATLPSPEIIVRDPLGETITVLEIRDGFEEELKDLLMRNA